LFVELQRTGSRLDKLLSKVEFPLAELLAFYPFFRDGAQNSVHPLRPTASSTYLVKVADIICHQGKTARGGHYVVYSYQDNSNTWLCLDDSRQTPMSSVADVCTAVYGGNASGTCAYVIRLTRHMAAAPTNTTSLTAVDAALLPSARLNDLNNTA